MNIHPDVSSMVVALKAMAGIGEIVRVTGFTRELITYTRVMDIWKTIAGGQLRYDGLAKLINHRISLIRLLPLTMFFIWY